MEKSKRSQAKKVTSDKSSWIREFSAGGVVYKRVNENELLWLLIQPKETERWQLPKGHLKKEESSKEAAVREVSEEGGIRAIAHEKLGIERYFFRMEGKKIVKTVTIYLMEYVGETGEAPDTTEVEKIAFVSFEKAQEQLSFKNDREMLQKANEILNRGRQVNLV